LSTRDGYHLWSGSYAREALDRARTQSSKAHQWYANFLTARGRLGPRDEALGWLDTAPADRSHAMALFDVDPQLDPLRDDPRFAQLRRRSNH
jgi:hypothetical protein